jgi:LysR family transcriptional regulator, hydrogen peroxide-inducible genes activator
MITTKQLRYFDALAATLHFGRAAEPCAVTQPALSMQIRELERQLGIALVERRATDVVLTATGEEIAERARRILNELRDLADFARRRSGTLTGALRLGLIPSIAPYLLPETLPQLLRAYPNLDLELRETQTAQLMDELLRGGLDCTLIALPWPHPQLEYARLFDDEFVLAASRETAGRIDPARLQSGVASEKLLLLEEGHCLRDQALQFCQIDAPGLRRSLGATSLATIVQMVAAGYGVTLLPRMCARIEVRDERIALMPFDEPRPKREIGLVWRKSSQRRGDFEALAAVFREAGLRACGA